MRLSLLLMCLVLAVRCQDCNVGGNKLQALRRVVRWIESIYLAELNSALCCSKTCVAHEQCCGGCCFEYTCIDTYRSCLQDLNVCKDHVCRGEENCVPYQPRLCSGCEPLPVCREKRQT